MGWSFVGHRGSATSKVSGVETLHVSPTANLAVGSIVVVRCVSDNVGLSSGANTHEHGLSDTRGHTWTKLREHRLGGGGAGNGVTVSLWATKITTQLSTNDVITLHTSSAATAKCMAVEVFAVAADKTFAIAGVASTHSTTQPSVSLSGLSSAERLWLGHVGAEGPNSDSYTQDPDYTNNTSVGTSGGVDTSNVYSRFGSRIATISGDTFNPTLSANRDNCALLVALDEVDDGVVVTPAPAAARAAALIGSVILGSLIVTPAAASARATAVAPTLHFGVTPTPAVSRALAVDPTVEIGGGGGTIVGPDFAPSRAIAIAPTVQLGSLTLAPDVAASRATAIAPAVQLGSLTLTPPIAAARARAIAPTVQLGSITVTPAVAVTRSLAISPAVQLGNVTVVPAPALSRALAIGPAVEQGGLVLIPAPSTARALAVAPVVQLGSIAVSPVPAASRAIAVAPTVQLGSIAVTPTFAVVRALAIAPDVQLGSLTLIPAPSAARALAISPAVQIGGGVMVTPGPALARALAIVPGIWIRPKEGQLVVTARTQSRSFVAPVTGRSWISSSRDRSWN